MNLDLVNQTYLYNKLYKKYGEEFIIDAGFYDNGESHAIAPDLNLIDFTSFKKNYNPKDKNVLLYITGSFAPIHDGHINSVLSASAHMTSLGYNVIGAVISPDHDGYVIDNKIHRNDFNINERITFIKDKIDATKSNIPLVCDIWNGLFNSKTINFTDFTLFLKNMLELNKMEDTELLYVCGGDNARFAKTFVHSHGAVIVGRPSYESEVERVLEEINKINPEALIFHVNGNNTMSSTEIRDKNYKKVKVIEKKNLILKVENDEVKYVESILPILKQHYSNIKLVFNAIFYLNFIRTIQILDDIDENTRFICLDRKFYDYIKNNHSDTPLSDKIIHFDMSRIYKIGGIVREGYSVNDNFSLCSDNFKYVLIDDDSVTGGTIRYALSKLRELCYDIIHCFVLNSEIYDVYTTDIMDLGDLIFGKKNTGLVIRNNKDKIKRYPYILPYVSPYNRSSVLNPIQFTIDIIEWNNKNNNRNTINNKYLKSFKQIVR